jgi:DHA2 family multidrug resistance protein-like MFS transporter
VDIGLFKRPAFTVALSANWLGIFVAAGAFLFITQYLQLVVGLSPLEAGLWTIPSAFALIAGSMTTPVFARWARPAYAMAAGLAIATVGCVLLAWVTADHSLAILVVGSVILYLGIAPVITLATDSIVSAAPPERAGSAASLSETSIELGGALGIAVLGSVGVAVYRSQLSEDMPGGVTNADAGTSLETLGGAVHVSRQLGGQLGADLLAAAESAFTSGLVTVSIVCGAIMALLAGAAVVFLRDVGVSAPASADAPGQATDRQAVGNAVKSTERG